MMCRSLAEGGRRCPHSDMTRVRFRSRADNAARKQISRYKQQMAQLETANPALQQVIRAQLAVTDPTDSDVIQRLRTDRSRARRSGDTAAVATVDAQLVAAQLVLAEQRLAEARGEAKAAAPTAGTATTRQEPGGPEGWKETQPRTTSRPEPATVQEAIRAAYEAGADPKKPNRLQRLAEVRARLSPRFSREEVDLALKEMGKTQTAYLAPNPNRKNVTEADHAAAVRVGGDENDMIAFDD